MDKNLKILKTIVIGILLSVSLGWISQHLITSPFASAPVPDTFGVISIIALVSIFIYLERNSSKKGDAL